MFTRKHQCHSCSNIHPRAPFQNAADFGYECPACGVNLRFPTKKETAGWERIETYSLINYIFFFQSLVLSIFSFQSVTGTFLVVIAFTGTTLWLYRNRPSPLVLKHIEHIYSQKREELLERETNEKRSVSTNIQTYLAKQEQIQKNKNWWQFWV